MKLKRENDFFSRALLFGALLLATFVFVPGIQAQAFKVQGGSSSLLDAHGGSVEVRARNYTGKIGLGFMDGPRIGFSLTAPYRGWVWALGDQAVPFSLPTDVFNRGYYFLGRGVGATRKRPGSSLFLYGGSTSRAFFSPFLQAATSESGVGLLFYDRKLSPSIRFQSNNLLSRRHTSLHSLEWTAREDLRFGLTGGIGSNDPYWSTSLSFARERIGLVASYARAGDAFRRIQVESPALAETDRENIRFEFVPVRDVRVFISRQNYLSPEVSRERASVNGFGAGASIDGFHLHGSFWDSSSVFGDSTAMAMGVRRNFWQRLDASLDFLFSDPEHGESSENIVSTFRETITPRLALTQMITHGNGQTGIAFGGNFLSNRFSAGVEYQTVYIPFAQSNGSQFRQVLMVNMRMQLPRGMELNGASHVNPLGQVRYTAYGSGFAYRGDYGSSGGSSIGSFHPYIVRGYVLEDDGEPVRGAAVRVDEELVFTDSQGAFFVRRKKEAECPLVMAFDEFILPGSFEVIEMPARVIAAREENAPWYEIRLKRVKSPPVAGGDDEKLSRELDGPQSETVVHSATEVPMAGRTLTPFLSTGSHIRPMATRVPKTPVKVSQGNAAPAKLQAASTQRPVAVRKRKPVKRTVKSGNRRRNGRATARNRGPARKPAARTSTAARKPTAPSAGKPVAKGASTATRKPAPARKQVALGNGTARPGSSPGGNR